MGGPQGTKKRQKSYFALNFPEFPLPSGTQTWQWRISQVQIICPFNPIHTPFLGDFPTCHVWPDGIWTYKLKPGRAGEFAAFSNHGPNSNGFVRKRGSPNQDPICRVHHISLLSRNCPILGSNLHCWIDPYQLEPQQGGGGSFKDRKPIWEVRCCESWMAEQIHWWIERWLERRPVYLSVYLPV